MATCDVDVGLADDSHPEVVEGPGKETGEGGHKDHGPVTTGHSDSDPSEILLADETFHMSFGVDLTKFLAESGIFHVAIQPTDSVVVFANLHQSCSIGLSRRQFVALFVAWRLGQFDIVQAHGGRVNNRGFNFRLDIGIFQQCSVKN